MCVCVAVCEGWGKWGPGGWGGGGGGKGKEEREWMKLQEGEAVPAVRGTIQELRCARQQASPAIPLSPFHQRSHSPHHYRSYINKHSTPTVTRPRESAPAYGTL